MTLPRFGLHTLMRIAGVLIIVGLAVEVVSLLWVHPLAFVLFAFVGATLIGLGIVVYFASLIFAANPPSEKQL